MTAAKEEAGNEQAGLTAAKEEAGSDRQDQAEERTQSPQTQRAQTFPRWKYTPADKPRRGQGSSLGWGEETTHEWQPSWMRWSVLIDADLAKLGAEVRNSLFEQAKRNFDCIASWRKDRHSEHSLVVPYRLAVRGVEAQACMEFILEALCSQHAEQVDVQDIWSTPTPDTNQQTVVQQGLEGVIVKVLQEPESSDAAPSGSQGSAMLRPAPGVHPQTCPGLVFNRLQHARSMREKCKAGLTAEKEEEATQEAAEKQKAGLTAAAEEKATQEAAQAAFLAEVGEFTRKVKSIALEKHSSLHWEYQEAMKDHRGHSLQEVLEHGQDVPEDLRSSEVYQMVDECHIVLCVSTFKRNFQLQEALGLNVSQTWPWRLRVTWCIFDANPDEDLLQWALETFELPMKVGHIVWVRAQVPWSTFHMSVAKNTAHVAGWQTTLQDRLARCSKAGLTADEADLTAKTFVMNWDNDNILCLKWLHDCLRQAARMTSEANQQSVHPLIACQWHNRHMGTCGRIDTT